MRGRKPKPLAKADQDGDTRKIGARKFRERINSEAKATRGLPTCPEHLNGYAREAWLLWREELEGMGLDRRPDAMMLEGACAAYASARWAEETIAKYGRMIVKKVADPKTGELVPVDARINPAVHIGDKAWKQLRSFCSEFGLSPVSRTRLAIEKQDSSADDLAKILMQPREQRQTPTVQ